MESNQVRLLLAARAFVAMARAPARIQPLDATAAEAVAAPSASLEAQSIEMDKKQAEVTPEESLELHGKKLAAAFTGMMVSSARLSATSRDLAKACTHSSLCF